MAAQKIYKWGFVAAGKMARNQARDLAHSPRSAVHAVFSRTQASARLFAQEFGGTVYDTLEEMLVDPEVDLIYISSPNNFHYGQVKLALEAGKPVLCEKPFTLNAAELTELIEIARRNKVFLMEAMWVRYLPAMIQLRELLAASVIGNIRLARAPFHINLPYDPLGRIYNPELGGGALLDVGIYPISLMSMLFAGAQPDAIASAAQMAETGVDAHFGAVFNYRDGAMAFVSAGVDGHYPEDIVIHGEQGKIVSGRGWKFSGFRVEKGGQLIEEVNLPLLGGGYSYQAEEVARCLDAGALESSIMPLDESLGIMQTIDRVRKQWG